MEDSVLVRDDGQPLRFTFAELLKYHGSHSPAGVAHAFVVLRLALGRLDPEGPERSTVTIRTAFPGPGARDGFELVTRAVTGGRYTVDKTLAHRELGPFRQLFVFHLSQQERTVELRLREGIMGEEFVTLVRAQERTAAQEARLTLLKRQLAQQLLALPPEQVYTVTLTG